MNQISQNQRKTLVSFTTDLAVAWFTSGVIVPFFTKHSVVEKVGIAFLGLIASFIFISIALELSRKL